MVATALLAVDGDLGPDGAFRGAHNEGTQQGLAYSLWRSPSFLLGSTVFALWLGCATLGPAFVPIHPFRQDLLATNSPPSRAHVFGTDSLGRDVFSRTIAGARQLLVIAPVATTLALAVGTLCGLVQGFYQRWVDFVLGRLSDAVLSVPVILMAFLFIVAIGPSTATLILVIGLVFSIVIARTVRSFVLREMQEDYVVAARLRGEGDWYILLRELLPNVAGVIAVEGTVRLGYAVFSIATLSFLGFGVRPPTPDWGTDVALNYQFLAAGFWWAAVFPAIAIGLVVISVNLMAQGIEGAIAR